MLVAPPFAAELEAKLLQLNNQYAEELSFKTAQEFSALLAVASFVRAEAQGLALLVAMHDKASYDNANFAWFKNRYDSFMYIDRVVVSEAARGKGLARLLYAALENEARLTGRQRLVCEVNATPANAASDAFHTVLGFVPVGERQVDGAKKIVRYWCKELA